MARSLVVETLNFKYELRAWYDMFVSVKDKPMRTYFLLTEFVKRNSACSY